MALFKFRKGGDEPQAAAPPAESIEALRRRARHRLIGATVLVLAGVIGFPLVFDTQPRPIPVDIPIEIPDRNKVKPLAVPTPMPSQQGQGQPPPKETQAQAQQAPRSPAPSAAGPVTAASGLAPPAKSAPAFVPSETQVAKAEPPRTESNVQAAKPETKPSAKVDTKPEAKPEPKPEPKPSAKSESAKPEPAKAEPRSDEKPAAAAKADEAARARALLEGKPVPASPPAAEVKGRFVVQVGAFADATKARETRQRMERAGLKTYAQVAETKDGKRIRVRVGPFATRAEAEKASEKIKGLDLPAAILTL